MREVRSPYGTVWECFIEWEGRRPLHRAFRRLRAQREARARYEAENVTMDLAGGCLDLLSFIDIFAAVLFLVTVVSLIIVGWPLIAAALFGIVELGIIIVLIAAGFMVRTVTRRPWRVVAVNETGEVWAYRQVGWFASRELVRQLAEQLQDGRHPADILPDALEAGSPFHLDPDAPMGLLAKPWARLAAVAFIATCVVTSIAVLIARS